MEAVATRHRVSTAQIALAWLLARSPNILLIPRTGSQAHLEESIAAGCLRIDSADVVPLGGA